MPLTSQFVILNHQLRGGEHWDLMLEHGDALATWQLLADPTVTGPAWPIEARRIGNHRKAYLDYEGPISGGRGDVRQVDRGPVEIGEMTATRCVFRARGVHLAGEFELNKVQRDEWRLFPSEAPKTQSSL